MAADLPPPRPADGSGNGDVGTALGLSAPVRACLLVGGPLLGLVLGYYLPTIAAWLLTLPWLPMRGPIRLIASFDAGWSVTAFLVAGVVLGFLLAHAVIAGSLRLTLTDRQLRLERNGTCRTVDRELVDAVFVDGSELVVLDRASRQLVRERHDSTTGALARAMRAHGYPWTDRDPYEPLYRRWVRDSPELPAAVNAVLVAREIALRRKIHQDVGELRDEVQNLGFVVRDDGHRQYWRPLVRS